MVGLACFYFRIIFFNYAFNLRGTIACFLEFLRVKSNIYFGKSDSWLFTCAKLAKSDAFLQHIIKSIHSIGNSLRSLRNGWFIQVLLRCSAFSVYREIFSARNIKVFMTKNHCALSNFFVLVHFHFVLNVYNFLFTNLIWESSFES